MPRSRPGVSTSIPSMITLPAVDGWVPRMARSSVDLPQPLGPTRATISPRAIFKLTSYNTRFLPNQWLTSLHSKTMSWFTGPSLGVVPGEQLPLTEAEGVLDREAEGGDDDQVEVRRRRGDEALLIDQPERTTESLALRAVDELGGVKEDEGGADGQSDRFDHLGKDVRDDHAEDALRLRRPEGPGL